MVTRFRLTSDVTAPAVSPALQSYMHTQTTRRQLLLTNTSTLTTEAYAADASDHLVAGDAHHIQFVSAPLVAGPTFTSGDTLKFCIQGLEGHIGNNLQVQLFASVVSEDGTTVQATLRTKVLEGLELATTLTSRFLTTTLTGSYTLIGGDRIVVEFSVSGSPTGASGVQGHNGSLRWGSGGAAGDLLENDTETGTTRDPWIEFLTTVTEATGYNLTGSLFTKAPTFPTGTVIAAQTVTGVLFTKSPTFNVGSVSRVFTDPTDIADLAVWLTADSIAVLSDGDPLTTWEDSSPNNRDASQSTAANKPLYKTNQRNGLPAVRFDGTDDWLEVANLASLFSGTDLPISIYMVARSNITANQGNMFTLERSTTTQPVHEWLTRPNTGADAGVFQSVRRGDSGSLVSVFNAKAWMGNYQWCVASDVFTGTLSTQEINGNRYTKTTQNVVAMTVDRATIGYWRQAATAPYNGDIAEIIIYSRALTDTEQDDLGNYLATKYDLPWGPYNPASPQTIPTPDSPGNEAIAPSVIYFPNGWNGSAYWMGFTPYTGGDEQKERPCVVVSADGVTWAAPSGGSNPITADPPGAEHFADTWITYDPVGDDLYLYYVDTDESTFQRLVERHSSDGITWSAQTTVLDLALDKVTNPSVVYDPTAGVSEKWKLWYTEDSPTRLVKYRTSASPASGYSAATTVVAANPFASTRDLWQQNVMVHKHGAEYVMYISDMVAGSDGVAYVGKSSDGLTWDFYPAFIADRKIDSTTLWDSDTIYGGCLLRYANPDDGGLVQTGPDSDLRLWYAARDVQAEDVWQTGYTVIPRSVADITEMTGITQRPNATVSNVGWDTAPLAGQAIHTYIATDDDNYITVTVS